MSQTKRRVVFSVLLLVIVISVAVRFLPTPLLIWNTTTSLPKGIYRIHAGYEVGDIVAFDIPKTILPLVRERGWIPFVNYDPKLTQGYYGKLTHP